MSNKPGYISIPSFFMQLIVCVVTLHREDEQKRGITMHTSAITLLYRSQERRVGEDPSAPLSTVNYLVNLVDSPVRGRKSAAIML